MRPAGRRSTTLRDARRTPSATAGSPPTTLDRARRRAVRGRRPARRPAAAAPHAGRPGHARRSRRAELVERLFGGQGRRAARSAWSRPRCAQRWSTPWDLTDALEGAGDDARCSRPPRSSSEPRPGRGRAVPLRADPATPRARLTALLDEHVGRGTRGASRCSTSCVGEQGHAGDARRCCDHAVTQPAQAQHHAGDRRPARDGRGRRERSVARVISAVPLTDAQQERLAAALSAMYGRAISVRTALDPRVRGGLVVRVGDEVIDGSIAHQLAAARAALSQLIRLTDPDTTDTETRGNVHGRADDLRRRDP